MIVAELYPGGAMRDVGSRLVEKRGHDKMNGWAGREDWKGGGESKGEI